ncbi:MAG: TolA protein [uncultured Paraburkholderia sp.]|uniref:cell envelope integrity protein TolA n=1 Tax=uncultured Paraburkholderia sp. TaxID=1822466 RepID=UPI0025950E30|nr:cell envelope integrity protein TolA [uncultured Paraburkholderia sp.]CAH2898276.1 MAG: TolA protein [uncultured Paraburkholderia sp.]CAH2915558.1 MAG: TolA protein [uncultured Paraburkholderia sp.]
MIRKNTDYPLQPPRERGTGRAFAFALVMHALLGFFLYHGIQWQNSTPEGAEAELWTEVPDTAIPRVAPPPPAPVVPAPPVADEQAEIALQEKKRKQQEAARQAQLAEQQRQEKLQAQQEAEAKRQQQLAEQAAQLAAQKAAAAKQKQQQQQAEKLKQQQLAEQQKQQQQQLKEQQQEKQQEQQKQAEAEAQKKADAQKAAKAKAQAAQAEAAAQAKKVDAERRARLAQMQGMAGPPGSTGNGLGKSGTGSGSGGNAASPGYADKVRRVVRPNISWGGETEGLETVIAVRCSPTGTLLSATIAHSSGNSAWDDAALRAVQRSDPMPQDIDGKTPASFRITLRPAG